MIYEFFTKCHVNFHRKIIKIHMVGSCTAQNKFKYTSFMFYCLPTPPKVYTGGGALECMWNGDENMGMKMIDID